MSQSTPSETPTQTTPSALRPRLLMVSALLFLMLAVCGGGLVVLSRSTVTGTKLVYSIEPGTVDAQDIVAPLQQRLEHVTPYGASVIATGDDRFQVILPTADPRDVEYSKRLISSGGHLRFLILANTFNHQTLFNLAEQQAAELSDGNGEPERDVKNDSGTVVARWVTAARQEPLPDGGRPLYGTIDQSFARNSETGEIVEIPPDVLAGDTSYTVASWMDTQGINSIDLLAVVEPTVEVNGSDLSYAALTFDQNGQPAVAINLTDQGSARFFALTASNEPMLDRYSKLAIILDDQVLSSPNILAPIRKEARITGRFTQEEVQFIVDVLKSGAIPTEISDQPISEEEMEVSVGLLDRLGF